MPIASIFTSIVAAICGGADRAACAVLGKRSRAELENEVVQLEEDVVQLRRERRKATSRTNEASKMARITNWELTTTRLQAQAQEQVNRDLRASLEEALHENKRLKAERKEWLDQHEHEQTTTGMQYVVMRDAMQHAMANFGAMREALQAAQTTVAEGVAKANSMY